MTGHGEYPMTDQEVDNVLAVASRNDLPSAARELIVDLYARVRALEAASTRDAS